MKKMTQEERTKLLIELQGLGKKEVETNKESKQTKDAFEDFERVLRFKNKKT